MTGAVIIYSIVACFFGANPEERALPQRNQLTKNAAFCATRLDERANVAVSMLASMQSDSVNAFRAIWWAIEPRKTVRVELLQQILLGLQKNSSTTEAWKILSELLANLDCQFVEARKNEFDLAIQSGSMRSAAVLPEEPSGAKQEPVPVGLFSYFDLLDSSGILSGKRELIHASIQKMIDGLDERSVCSDDIEYRAIAIFLALITTEPMQFKKLCTNISQTYGPCPPEVKDQPVLKVCYIPEYLLTDLDCKMKNVVNSDEAIVVTQNGLE